MKISIYVFVLSLIVSITQRAFGQDNNASKIEVLRGQKTKITEQEKDALKIEVENINQRFEVGEINKEQANSLKEFAAQKRAMNIENRITIVENRIKLVERNGAEVLKLDTLNYAAQIEIGLGNKDDEGDRILGILYNKNTDRDKPKDDIRTSSDLVIAAGFVNAGSGAQPLINSKFKPTGSRFFEVGYAWNTRVFKNTNWLRLKYGVSFQFNGFKPNNNEVFMNNTNVYGDPYAIDLVDFNLVSENDVRVEKSKLRMDSFIFPVHFEFGASEKKVNGKYVRYNTDKKFKFGIGAYLGINYNTIQKLKFSDITQVAFEDLGNIFYKGNQSTVKGLSAYAGCDNLSLYLKYESSTSIRRLVGQHIISLGLRFDL